eukprot:14184987-Alexandrium_andersonii.AAC.1
MPADNIACDAPPSQRDAQWGDRCVRQRRPDALARPAGSSLSEKTHPPPDPVHPDGLLWRTQPLTENNHAEGNNTAQHMVPHEQRGGKHKPTLPPSFSS